MFFVVSGRGEFWSRERGAWGVLEERVKDILLHGDHPDQLISQTKDDIVVNSVAEVVEWANEI